MNSIKVPYHKLMEYIIDLLTKYYKEAKFRGKIDIHSFDSATIEQIFIYKDDEKNEYGVIYKGEIQSLACECLYTKGDSACSGQFLSEMLYKAVFIDDVLVTHKLVEESMSQGDYDKKWEVVLHSIKNVEYEVTIPAKVVKRHKWVIEGVNA